MLTKELKTDIDADPSKTFGRVYTCKACRASYGKAYFRAQKINLGQAYLRKHLCRQGVSKKHHSPLLLEVTRLQITLKRLLYHDHPTKHST